MTPLLEHLQSQLWKIPVYLHYKKRYPKHTSTTVAFVHLLIFQIENKIKVTKKQYNKSDATYTTWTNHTWKWAGYFIFWYLTHLKPICPARPNTCNTGRDGERKLGASQKWTGFNGFHSSDDENNVWNIINIKSNLAAVHIQPLLFLLPTISTS